jgi:mannose-6-phosphate isomerase-like protein (cupin superfamily)
MINITPETKNDIEKCLQEYVGKIDGQKPFKLSLSTYQVDKPWGYEIWLDLTDFYAFKLIHMNEGNMSSLQSHDFKVEANYVIEGTAEVLLENDKGEMESFIFEKGSGWTVPVGRKHRVIAKTSYTALEVSSPNLNDVIRYNDKFGRSNGKIDSEHNV